MMDKITGEQIARLLLDKANQSGSIARSGVSQEIAEAILGEHRTLQQGAIAILFGTLIEIGEMMEVGPMTTDLRNQASIEACKRLAELQQAGEINANFPLV